MKKIILTTVIILIGLTSAYAVDGTITINGQITDKTCNVNSAQGKDFTINLPNVSKSTLTTSGNTAGRTPFQLQLSNCSGGKVATYFEPGGTVDGTTGRLKNQAATTPATQVQVQLLGDNFNFIPVLVGTGTPSSQANSQWVDVVANGSVNLNYFAEYYATGAATSGQVQTSIKYTIIYQ